MIRPANLLVAPALLAAATCLPGCIKAQNDRFDVGGRTPAALEPGGFEPRTTADAQSVVSLDRANWAATEYHLDSHGVYHNPTYARRNTTFDVTARASGRYPTVAEALSIPGGPSESEQLYDALTWPFVIAPATVAVPLGFVIEPQGMDIQRSPQWAYDRHAGRSTRGTPTGDPFVDRLGLPVIEGDAAPEAPPMVEIEGGGAPVQAAPPEPGAAPFDPRPMFPIQQAPGGPPIGEPDPAEMPVPTGEPDAVPVADPGAAPAGGRR